MSSLRGIWSASSGTQKERGGGGGGWTQRDRLQWGDMRSTERDEEPEIEEERALTLS